MKRLMNHGTMAAVRRHQRDGSRMCELCREAQSLHHKVRREVAARKSAADKPEKPKVDLTASWARIREYLEARDMDE